MLWTGSEGLGSLFVTAAKLSAQLAVAALLLSLAWAAGSWIRHRLVPLAARVRFRDFVHLGRMRLFLGLSLAAAALLAAYYWPGRGLPGDASLREVTMTVTTDGRDMFREVENASYKRALIVPLDEGQAGELSALLGSYSWHRTMMDNGNRYEAGAVTVEGTLEKGKVSLPYRLVATENKVFWQTGGGADFVCYFSGAFSLAQELVELAGSAQHGA